jgi:CubicO group peptidase (beta-lactamase class C family)
MASTGFSKDRLARLHDVMARHVECRDAPGVVALLARRGDVHVEVIGATAFDSDQPMRRDSIFRVTSMTKPVTAVAAMTLVEECVLRLDDPVDELLPELREPRVLARLDAPVDETVPADRAITLRDLLTFTFGSGMVMGPPDQYPILQAIEALHLGGVGPPDAGEPLDRDEWMRRFGTLPLMRQPGATWMYNTGSWILGVLIERATGMSLDAFMRERIFEPLGMVDTGFTVGSEKVSRMPASYLANAENGALQPWDERDWSQPPVFCDGAAGLASTVDDFFAFGQMMLNRGTLDGERILARPTVEMMTVDHLTAAQKASSGFFPGAWNGRGWGFGMSVVTGTGGISTMGPGRFGWDGGSGTSWYTDPNEELVAILMTQRGAFPLFSPLYLDFWTSVYQAIDD